MKRNETPAALPAVRRPSLWGRFLRFKQSMGVRTRIFLYFLAFTALLLMLLWLFQIVLLDDFYRLQKTDMLKSSSESIVQNINNENLDALVDRIAEENNVCILVTSEKMEELASADISPGCIVHHMNPRDLQQIANSLEDDGVTVSTFPMQNFRNRMYDEKKFLGRVPPSDDGETRSMMTVQRATMADGTMAYVFLNTMVTPVTATVQTIRNELYVITAILILLSFLISLVLSRRITQPLVEATQAAGALSRGEYTPVQNVGYREIAQLNAQLTQTARDLRRVEEMQQELKSLQQKLGITTIYVTHDQDEALSMSDIIAVMHAGRVEQVGTPWEIYFRPVNRFVADFIGTVNFLDEIVTANEGGVLTVEHGDMTLKIPTAVAVEPGEAVTLVLRPECIRIAGGDEPADDLTLRGTIETYSFLGRMIRYWVRVKDEVFVIDDANVDLGGVRTGDVTLRLDPQKLHVLKDGGGRVDP